MGYNKAVAGRSLVEMMGVLVIGMAMTVTAFSGIQRLRTSMKRQEALEDINKFAQEVRTLYSGQNMYDIRVQDNIMGVMSLAGTSIPNPFGGEYKIGILGNMETSPYFKITITGLAQADCIYFATMKFADARDLNGRDNKGKALIGDGTAAYGPYASCSADGDNKITAVYQ